MKAINKKKPTGFPGSSPTPPTDGSRCPSPSRRDFCGAQIHKFPLNILILCLITESLFRSRPPDPDASLRVFIGTGPSFRREQFYVITLSRSALTIERMEGDTGKSHGQKIVQLVDQRDFFLKRIFLILAHEWW